MVATDARQARIFISYKRNSDPDAIVAEQVYAALSVRHRVFIDRVMPIGTDWVERIDTELRQADYLLCLLSERSIASEMVATEITTARDLQKESNGRPAILPVRLAYTEAFPYHLRAYLDRYNWFDWRSPTDTPELIAALERTLSGESGPPTADVPINSPRVSPDGLPEPIPRAEPLPLELPEGTIDPESAFYIARPTDAIAVGGIARQGVTITIKGPRQMGKSSLLMRTIEAATHADKQVVFLDFQLFDQAALADANVFLRQFCALISDEVGLPNRVDESWNSQLSGTQLCHRYIQRNILAEMERPLVLAMDEVESVFDTDFRTDFFAMLRAWHNARARDPLWKKLDLTLVTSTEPYQLIDNLNQSPFNVGEVIKLVDFSQAEVDELCLRHNSPLDSTSQKDLFTLLGGHPYLTRRALYLVASGRVTSSQLFEHAADDDGPFGDHLRHHLFRLNRKPELLDGLRQAIRTGTCPSDEIFFRLNGAGLVRREQRAVVPRCELYARYFRDRL